MLYNGDGFTIVYLYVLFLEDDVKCRTGYIVQLYVGIEKSVGVKRGKVNSKEFL
jgi:hypothetical protein